MKIKFSGVSCGYGSKEILELTTEISNDFSVAHESDALGGITTVSSNGEYIAVSTETFEVEIIQIK